MLLGFGMMTNECESAFADPPAGPKGKQRSATTDTSLPNLIFIVTDDQGVDAVSIPFFENQLDTRTPTFAALASQGRIFTNCRVNPKCSPTRAGLMTGRSAFETGVVGVVNKGIPKDSPIVRDRVSLQSGEITIAELLQQAGYETILVDKWHVGWANHPTPTSAPPYLGRQRPELQGFDTYIDYHRFFCGSGSGCGKFPPICDCPDAIDDDHMTWSVDKTIQSIRSRGNPSKPYALFFWSIDPHIRRNPNTWWEVSPSLLSDPSIYDFNNETDRYRAVVEAFDHEMNRMLVELGVIESGTRRYISKSDTVVLFMSDNGTPGEVSYFGPDRSKGSLFDGGIRVPMFVFGEDVPADGKKVERLLSHQDFFATLAQIAGISDVVISEIAPDSWSFADSIGWSDGPLPRRSYTISNRAIPQDANQTVTITDGRFKLIASAGRPHLAKLGGPIKGGGDLFFDLADGEFRNRAFVGHPDYRRLRQALVDYWPTAVAEPFASQFDLHAKFVASINSDDEVSEGLGSHPVGYEMSGETGELRETRILFRFDASNLIRRLRRLGRSFDDISDIQLILRFDHDSVLRDSGWTPNNEYATVDADTGPIHVYPIIVNWDRANVTWEQIEFGYQSQTELGVVDLAPHILNENPNDLLSSVPIERGTPISFGRNTNWLNVVRSWTKYPNSNRGIVLKSDLLPDEMPGDQCVWLRFQDADDVRLRITFK